MTAIKRLFYRLKALTLNFLLSQLLLAQNSNLSLLIPLVFSTAFHLSLFLCSCPVIFSSKFLHSFLYPLFRHFFSQILISRLHLFFISQGTLFSSTQLFPKLYLCRIKQVDSTNSDFNYIFKD